MTPEESKSLKKRHKLPWYWGFSAFKEAIITYVKDGAFYHGAALAYYTLFAFIPIIYLTSSIFGRMVGPKNMKEMVSDLLRTQMGMEDSTSIMDVVNGMSMHKPNFFFEMVSIAVLLYSCSAFFVSLKRSLNEFFNVNVKNRREENLFLDIIGFRFISMGLLAIFALIIILFYFAQVFIFSAIQNWNQFHSGFMDFSLNMLQNILTIGSNLMIFTLVFKFIPDAKVQWNVAFKGAIFTSILLVFSQFIINYYLQNYFVLGKIGIANSLFVTLAWVHYSAQIVFLGAKFTYVVGKMTGQGIK
jgi:membrane protein